VGKINYSQLPDEDFRKTLPEETEKLVREVADYLHQMEKFISHYLTNVLEREMTLCRLLPKTWVPFSCPVLIGVVWGMKRLQ
jgi:hypothetical protein